MNIEVWERLVRIAVGVAMLSALILVASSWKWVGLLGLIPLVTGIIGWCPVYAWFSQD
jgi:cadmium resistance protein CadD (predicted permease)